MTWLDWVSPHWERTGYWRGVLEDMRGRHGEGYAMLLEAISHADPVGLLVTGCPPDEYAHEAESVYMGLPSVTSVEDVRRLMHTVFVDCFDERLAGPETLYDAPARAYWERANS